MSTENESDSGSVELIEVRQALEKNGVEVERLSIIGTDPYLKYSYGGDDHRHPLLVVALTIAKEPSLVTNAFTGVAVDPETGRRRGSFHVSSELIDEYRRNSISKMEYGAQVAQTWEETVYQQGGEK